MKAIIGTDFNKLKKSEQDRIYKICINAVETEVNNKLDAEIITAQVVWIRMAIVNLAQCGVDREKIEEFLGSWRNIYRKNARIDNKEEQDAWLDGRITEVFGSKDWVDEYIDTLRKI